MKTVFIERSTGEVRSGDWVEKLDLTEVNRIVVGMGPGSFAGIRSAIAFAQGYAIGKPGVEVLGLPSPCASLAEFLGVCPHPEEQLITVIGDARQNKLWLAEFSGYLMKKPVYQVDSADVLGSVPKDSLVISPDHKRIGGKLAEWFGERYRGEWLPTARGLEEYAARCPELLKKEPLPIYLNPAVRN